MTSENRQPAAAGTRFLVLELVEGVGLDQRLSSGPLEVEASLEITRQIAEALEVAHAKGIIHESRADQVQAPGSAF